MEKIVITATRRTVTGKQVGALRRAGQLPAVLYGHHVEPTAMTLDLREASRALASLTGSSIITINLDGKEFAALVREKQRNYITNTLLHVDFQAVSLTEKLRAAVEIVLTGASSAVKDFNGVVVTGVSHLEVEALPADLPERFVVDISGMKKIGDALYVRDIAIPEKVELLADPDEMVVLITAGAAEEVEEAAEAGPEEPEVIE